MKMKPEQLERLADLLVTAYRAQQVIAGAARDADLRAKIIEIIGQNFAEEEAIEEEARKLLASHARTTREMDHYKMFLLAKQKLAARRGFIL